MSGHDMQGIARKLRRGFIGPIDLDNSHPIDIYELFEAVTGRDYNVRSHGDELLILEIVNAYEGN